MRGDKEQGRGNKDPTKIWNFVPWAKRMDINMKSIRILPYLDIFHLFFIFIQDKESPLQEPRNLRMISADIERRKISLGYSKSGIVILSSDSAGRAALWADA